jgi:hypothetical protein
VAGIQAFPTGEENVVLDGADYLLNTSVDVVTIVIQNNGKLTVTLLQASGLCSNLR